MFPLVISPMVVVVLCMVISFLIYMRMLLLTVNNFLLLLVGAVVMVCVNLIMGRIAFLALLIANGPMMFVAVVYTPMTITLLHVQIMIFVARVRYTIVEPVTLKWAFWSLHIHERSDRIFLLLLLLPLLLPFSTLMSLVSLTRVLKEFATIALEIVFLLQLKQ